MLKDRKFCHFNTGAISTLGSFNYAKWQGTVWAPSCSVITLYFGPPDTVLFLLCFVSCRQEVRVKGSPGEASACVKSIVLLHS